jgi:hypothetical protein
MMTEAWRRNLSKIIKAVSLRHELQISSFTFKAGYILNGPVDFFSIGENTLRAPFIH